MQDRRSIYICHTMYHVLIALVRAMRAGPLRSDLVLSSAVPEAEALKARLEAAGQNTAWGDILVVDEQRLDAQNNESAFYRLRHPGRPPYFALPDRRAAVYISNDWSALGRYLQREGIPYVLCEDTMGGTLDPDQHLLDEQRAAPPGRYRYWVDSRFCQTVESEDAARCSLFPPEKLVTFSQRALLESLTETEKEAARRVFLTQALPECADNATLLLPRSFVLDGLMDQKTQDALFLAVAAQYKDGPLFIKTHPRDETDYAALFPDAVVLDRRMPSEVLNFCLPYRFKRAVAVQSWVLRSFTAAEEKIFISLEDALAMLE